MKQPHTSVEIPEAVQCDFCAKQAEYDAKTVMGPWANLCEQHYGQYGYGLGLGKGQRLIVKGVMNKIEYLAEEQGVEVKMTHVDEVTEGDVLWVATPNVWRVEVVKVLDDAKLGGKPKPRAHCKAVSVSGRYFSVRPGDTVYKEVA